MDVANSADQRPEDVLDELARGDDNLGERLLRMARAASALDRASVLDLLMDDAELPAPCVAPAPAGPTPSETDADLNRLRVAAPSAGLRPGEREESSVHGCDVRFAPVVRRMEVAR
jgi:hypothetical protein